MDYKVQFSPDEGRTLTTLVEVTNQARPYPLSTHWTEHGLPGVTTDNLRVLITRTSKGRFPHIPSLARTPEVWGTFVGNDPKRADSIVSEDSPSSAPRQSARLSPEQERTQPVAGLAHSRTPSRLAALTVNEMADAITFESPYLKLGFSKKEPRLTYLSWDGLGQGNLDVNFLRSDSPSGPVLETFAGAFRPRAEQISWGPSFITYKGVHLGDDLQYDLKFTIKAQSFSVEVIRGVTQEIRAFDTGALQLWFDARSVPVHVLALALKKGPVGLCALPSIIHAVDQGSLRVTTKSEMPGGKLQVKGLLGMTGVATVTVGFLGPEAGTADGYFLIPEGTHRWGATFDVGTISPFADSLGTDPAIQKLRKGWLNALAFRPELGAFGLNAMRDVNRICHYMYSDIAFFTPELAPGLTALDLVRQSLETFMAGLPTYDGGSNIREYFFPTRYRRC